MLWWRDGIIYQIYPRSFQDSNGDGIGDLNGILSRLDYLADLGVDAIWLSPVYPSPDVDFGYDVSDYTGIDPKFGTMADFDCLLMEAHRRGIRVVMDLVLNHTSNQHPWFINSRKSVDSPYRDYYLWRAGKKPGMAPNNWQSIFGGSGWSEDAATGQYYYHMFAKEQPDLNWRNPAVRRALINVFQFWLERGVDGFRLDVFNNYFKHPELPDNPSALGLRAFDRQKHLYDTDQPEMLPLLKEIRELLDSFPERYTVGETFLGQADQAAKYIGSNRLHAAFNFDFLNCPYNPHKFLESVQRWEHLLGSDDWPSYVLNNHDVVRSATRWRCGEDDARLKVAATLLLTLRGTPFLYYGEEIGMRDLDLTSRSQVLDPVGKLYWPFYKGRDGCRSPMQWNDASNAGFSLPDAAPWLPIHTNYAWRNVDAQMQDPDSLFHFYRCLITLRRSNPALTQGLFLPLTQDTHFLLAYLRQTKDQTLLIALNFSKRGQRLVLGSGLARSSYRLLLSSHRDQLPRRKGNLLYLDPNEAILLELEK